ncbi:MAG: STAS domain-containing protein [Proteobacteria bacterium]|jgi:phospholipid transport system transporter-binding protein|nr:MAG: STAS domain-containing protein [Pseudomonadota bacterium]MBC6945272.1 STAS domain-containing protein [Gammaproteobacteria bacterium]MCE7901083.1 STAS domain-containing protein [Gammaproteobacteria bacterium PRO9]MCQ3933363.1 sulfate transporter [Gammaproteobacteria bacterium]MDL1880131.1 STAS domain-containing protein [Gammaproteobacteria bacterium PRO2]
MEPARFEVAGEGAFRVTGMLDFTSVPQVWAASQPLLQQAGSSPSVDLEGVTRVDSAGLALVLEWVALAGQNNQRLRILRAPDKLLALARISETEGFLAAAGTGSDA